MGNLMLFKRVMNQRLLILYLPRIFPLPAPLPHVGEGRSGEVGGLTLYSTRTFLFGASLKTSGAYIASTRVAGSENSPAFPRRTV